MIVMQAACVAFIFAGLAGIIAAFVRRVRLERNGFIALLVCSVAFVAVFAYLLNVLIRLQLSMANPFS
jgi:drug/metabolite transporter superfamily protein YnfA